MSRLLLLSLAASLMSAADDPETDLNRLQGSWRVVSVEHDGKRSMAAEKAVWEFSDDDLLIEVAGRAKSKGRISLAPNTTPKAISRNFTTAIGGDFIRFIERGIYRLEGETLWICFSEAARDRPTEFASKPGSRTTLVVLKRAGR